MNDIDLFNPRYLKLSLILLDFVNTNMLETHNLGLITFPITPSSSTSQFHHSQSPLAWHHPTQARTNCFNIPIAINVSKKLLSP